MRCTAIYVKSEHAATCKDIEAISPLDVLRKARKACPSDRKLGHITGNHVGDVNWDFEKRQKRKLQNK